MEVFRLFCFEFLGLGKNQHTLFETFLFSSKRRMVKAHISHIQNDKTIILDGFRLKL